jgi:anti-repressor protein
MKGLKVVEAGIVPVYEDSQARTVINAREMHKFLESGRDFSNWIRERIEKFDFVKGTDYSTILANRVGDGVGKPRTEYLLSIDMAKAGGF